MLGTDITMLLTILDQVYSLSKASTIGATAGAFLEREGALLEMKVDLGDADEVGTALVGIGAWSRDVDALSKARSLAVNASKARLGAQRLTESEWVSKSEHDPIQSQASKEHLTLKSEHEQPK